MRVLATFALALTLGWAVAITGGTAHAQAASKNKAAASSSGSHAHKHASAASGKGKSVRAAAREHEAPKTEGAAPKSDKSEAEHEAPHAEQAPEGVQKADPASAEKPARAETKKGVAPPPDSQVDVRSEGGTQVKTLEFSGLDIEGQLKTPQMLYFLNRLRAEFGHPRLPHRSFMPELEQSRKESAF